MHDKHDAAKGHRYLCRVRVKGSLSVSKTGGIGQMEFHGKLGAVVERDSGTVALLDMSDPLRPKVVGRYDDGAEDPFDGDVAFSHDGQFVFYARQTHQFSKDGLHVLDVSDPAAPSMAFYQASGGTLRVASYYDGTTEWVVFLDAVDGLVVSRFVPETGALVEAFRDPEPALAKVGGPASAGLAIVPKDPILEGPLLYVSTGGSGLQMYDFSAPEQPVLLGSWAEAGLADVEVRTTADRRTVYAASEYWFDKQARAEVFVLDATDPTAIRKVRSLRLDVPVDELWRVQGIERVGRNLLVSYSHAGLVRFTSTGRVSARVSLGRTPNEEAEPPPTEQRQVKVAGYAIDVERRGKLVYVADASTGMLHVLRFRR